MTPVETLLHLLPSAKQAGSGWAAVCPAHEDNSPSLSITESADGKALIKCHAGCRAEAVVSALGLTMRDLMPASISPNSPAPSRLAKRRPRPFETCVAAIGALVREHGPCSKRWTYRDAGGEPVGVVVRWDRPDGKKDIRPVARHPDGWRVGAMPEPRPLYRLPDLAAATLVVVTEGEKAADAAASIGFTATTSAGGSNAAGKTDWQPLAGKEVVILPDNDAPGAKFADAVAAIVTALTPSAMVKVVRLPGLPDGGDIVDWLAAQSEAAEPDTLHEKVTVLIHAAPVDPSPAGPVGVVPPSSPAARRWPDPMSEEAYIGPVGEYVRLIGPHTEADPAAVLVQCLLIFGSIIGRSPYAPVANTRHHLNEFMVLVGETAGGRKGTSMADARELFRGVDDAWDKDRVAKGLSSGEGLIYFVRDPVESQQPVKEKGRVTGYETVTTDPGVEDKRALVIEAEFVSVLKQSAREGNTLSPVLREAWESGDLRTMTKNSPTRATGAHVSVAGHITEAELKKYLSEVETANGFGNRFLWFVSKRSKFLARPRSPDPAALAPVRAAVAAAVAFAASAGAMVRDDEAADLWDEVYPVLEADRAGLGGALTARAAPHVIRLSAVYALTERSPVVQARHLKAALAVWDYSVRSVAYLFGDSTGDSVADDIARLLRSSPMGLSRTDISNYFARNVPAARLAGALAELRNTGKARVEQKADTGGRPAELWFPAGGAA